MNDDDNYIHKYYALFLSSKNQEDLISGTEYELAKQRFRYQIYFFYYKRNQIFSMPDIIVICFYQQQ